MADHDHVRPGGDAGDEGLEVLLPKLRERLVDRGGAIVRVRGRAAVTGEMLQTADDPRVTKTTHGGGNKLRRLVVIIAVGTVADGVAFLIRPDVGHGRKVRIEAVGRDVVREGLGVVIRALRAETAVAVHAVELRRADSVHEARDAAALFVDRDERCRFAAVRKRSGERRKLFAGGHVLRREQHTADRIFPQRGGETVRHARYGAAAGERLGLHDQQLADLLARGHAVQQCLRRVLPDGGGRAGRGLRLRGSLPAADTHDHKQHRQRREHEQIDDCAPVPL